MLVVKNEKEQEGKQSSSSSLRRAAASAAETYFFLIFFFPSVYEYAYRAADTSGKKELKFLKLGTKRKAKKESRQEEVECDERRRRIGKQSKTTLISALVNGFRLTGGNYRAADW